MTESGRHNKCPHEDRSKEESLREAADAGLSKQYHQNQSCDRAGGEIGRSSSQTAVSRI
jgi:hypothetical protein